MIEDRPEHPFDPARDIPRGEAKRIFTELVRVSQSVFGDTALVRGGEITQRDVVAFKSFYRQAVKISPVIFNPSTRQHLGLTARDCRFLGEEFNRRGFSLNLDLLEALAWAHDKGRVFSHRVAINDIVARVLAKRANFTQEFLAHTFDGREFMPVLLRDGTTIDDKKTSQNILGIAGRLTSDTYKAIVMIADNVSKYREGKLIRWSQLVNMWKTPQKEPGRETAWISEHRYLATLSRHAHEVGQFYFELGKWAENILGYSLDDAVDKMEQELQEKPLEEL